MALEKPLSMFERGLKMYLRRLLSLRKGIFLLELAPCLTGLINPAHTAPRFTTELWSVAGLHRAKSLSQLLIRVAYTI